MTDAAVRTEGLTKDFGAVRAVDDVNLIIDRGEVFGYLGPNGAGKTTTVRLLLDFLRPTAGRAVVLGGSGADPDVRRRIGYLPGDLRLDPDYTATDVIELFGSLRGGVDRRWVDTLLERFGLDPGRPVGELSTGNRRKVGVVQAFMSRPELLLLDEPTSGLDPLLQHQFNALVREVVAEGATVLLSSHVLPEVEALADRVGIVRKGRLVAVAGVEELRRTARQRIDLHVAGEVGEADVGRFRAVPEVAEASAEAGVVHLVVEGSVDRVLKVAAGLEVLRIVSREADLEDVFLRYYEGDE
ncbi:MAG TPA: ABC transporter ATP-binding protein [Acidimicrobiales bacterium]|nr:ABC transporter ATP-binding protein [Acidimicrobiales bacterium]